MPSVIFIGGGPPPVFISAGAVASDPTTVTPGLPAGYQANDIFLYVIESASNTINTAPSGYTQVTNSPQANGANAATDRLAVYWKRATGSESAPASEGVDHTIAVILCIRGCPTTGNPWDVTAGDTAGSGTGATCPSVTTTVPNCLVINIFGHGIDAAGAQVTGYTNANLANLTEVVDDSTTSGNGGGFGISTGLKASAGATGTTTATLATGNTQVRMTIALKPA